MTTATTSEEVSFVEKLTDEIIDVFNSVAELPEESGKYYPIVRWYFNTLDKYMLRWELRHELYKVSERISNIWGFLIERIDYPDVTMRAIRTREFFDIL